MKYTAGFIGTGNMGGALVEAAVKSVGCDKIAIFDINAEMAKEKSKKTGAEFVDLKSLVGSSKFVFLGVKPNVISIVLEQIKDYVTEDTVIVSMAAGVDTGKISSVLSNERVIRIMPNTPVTVGEGMILYCSCNGVTKSDIEEFSELMNKAGTLDAIDEKLIDAAAALSGCGPAFVYMFIDALADGAVKCGLPRDKALIYAKQTVLGSAYFSMNTDKHLDKLKDEVCSPGGTTIEGVLALEKGSFRHTVSSSVIAAFEKTKLL